MHSAIDQGETAGKGDGFIDRYHVPLLITSSRMGCLLDALTRAYDVLGLSAAADEDEVFRDLS